MARLLSFDRLETIPICESHFEKEKENGCCANALIAMPANRIKIVFLLFMILRS